MSKFNDLVASLEAQYPKFKVVPKESSKLMGFVNFFMKRINPLWMSRFTMTLGYSVYMPQGYIGTTAGYEILRHEAIHVGDFKKWKLLLPLSYVLLLPIGITLRALWEFRGYKESMRVELEDTGTISDHTIDFIAEQFTGWNYIKMCPFDGFIRNKLEAARAELLAQKK